MRRLLSLVILLVMVLSVNAQSSKWDIACQAYTFKEFSLSEALGKMEQLNIKYVELYPKQLLVTGQEENTHYNMPVEQIANLKKLLKKHGIKATSYGVVSPSNEKDWNQLFEFAKAMDIKTIVSEPKQELLPMIDALCQQYKIRVAIHNHPDPTRYWNPEIVLEALEGRSKYMGVCGDVGHWTRSGLDAATCLKQLEDHIFEIHTKDVNRTDKKGHAVVWGEGVIDWKSVKAELNRQKFAGKFVIEHEFNWENPVPDIEKNLSFFQSNMK